MDVELHGFMGWSISDLCGPRKGEVRYKPKLDFLGAQEWRWWRGCGRAGMAIELCITW